MDIQRDPLDDTLQDLRITGSVLLHEAYAAPWTITVPDEGRLRKLLGVDAQTRLLLFHFVRRGRFELHMPGVRASTVEASQVAICATGVAHRMSCGRGATPVSIEAVLQGRGPAGAQRDAADVTEMVCGVFMARAAPLNPMLAALPPLMTVATADAEFSPMLAGVAWMLAHEIERRALSGFACARILELFCAEAIRAYQRDAGARRTGWFRGLSDPRIAEAMRHVHAEPDRGWTVDALAGCVALSPSRFAARFKQTTGVSVMTYVARWRANLACRMLSDTTLGIAEIGRRVGYESLPAFSRAFKGQLGQAPASWRAERVQRRGRPVTAGRTAGIGPS